MVDMMSLAICLNFMLRLCLWGPVDVRAASCSAKMQRVACADDEIGQHLHNVLKW
jgi:hypothetical protein